MGVCALEKIGEEFLRKVPQNRTKPSKFIEKVNKSVTNSGFCDGILQRHKVKSIYRAGSMASPLHVVA